MSSYRIKNIVVPVDLSESSLNALDTAVVIAKKHKADLYVLNIEESNFGYDDSNSIFFPNSSNSADVLTALIGAIQHTHGVKPKLLQEEGNVSDIIIKVSLLYQSDLIVIGSHGASGYRDGFIGSNTYNVIKGAACPVLSIPVKKKYTTFRKVLFPIRPVSGGLMRYDIVGQFLNANATLDVLGLSYRLAEKNTSILRTIVNEVEHQLESDKIRTNVLWSEGSTITDDVIKYAQQNDPDLLVVTSALDVTSKPKFVGPHTQKIINCAKTALLSIKKITVASPV
jgi:nucleotide-binding universal stress UspA family protein